MEESSEAHMETDVSSTTEDVPETQEVTGSHGDVEVVMVVEKVKEEDIHSNANNEKQLPSQKVTSFSAAAEKSPKKDEQLQKNELKSPNKHSEASSSVPKSSLRTELLPKTTSKAPHLNESIQPSTLTQVSEPADSSSKVEVLQNEKEISAEKVNIHEILLPQNKEPENSIKKPNNLEMLEPQNNVKEKSVEKSPIKDMEVQKNAIKSPIKEKLLQDSTKTLKCGEFSVPDKSNLNGKISHESCKVKDEINKTVTTIVPINITLESETSNESRVESNLDASEKEHNKSISRELKSLIKSAKESKIISECTQLTSKTRKSRTALDSSNTSLNTSLEPDEILQGNRHGSNNSHKSNCSEPSDKIGLKRSMRSQNPDFVTKVKQFLNSVTAKVLKDSDEGMSDEEIVESKIKIKNQDQEKNDSTVSSPKKKRVAEEKEVMTDKGNKLRSDSYCWRCHWTVEQAANEKLHPPMLCTVCPRSFHYKCLSGIERSKISSEKSWVCPECLLVLHAESSDTRSSAMKKISLGMLCELLQFALERMMDINGVEPFVQPVDRTAFPDYDKYVVHPMDLSLMKENIAQGLYGSTEAFQADVQWILHNSIIFNTLQSKLTSGARALIRSCRLEMGEIEACPECYSAAHARRPTWFTDVCSTPHILLWAKLKGFPYWPAKGMTVNSSGLVDVRFFGAHDRAWVPPKDCFLFSEKDPNNFRTKRQDILDSMQEAEHHIRNISRKYGKFVYPPFKTQFDPTKLNEQLKMMIPSFEGEVIETPIKDKASFSSPTLTKEKRRSNSKSSKSSFSEVCDLVDTCAMSSRKMADGAVIPKEEDESNGEKDKTMEVDTSQSKVNETTKKRRRSGLEEAVLTIIESSTPEEKKKRIEDIEKKPDLQEPSSSKELIEKPKPKEEKFIEIEVSKSPPKTKVYAAPSKAKDDEPSSSTVDKSENELRVTPIRLVAVHRGSKQVQKTFTTKNGAPRTSTPKTYDKQSQRQKEKAEKSLNNESKEELKSQKRRNSKNKSLSNGSASGNTSKTDKNPEKKVEKTESKDVKTKDDGGEKNKEADKSGAEKRDSPKPSDTGSPRSAKDRLQFDDDTSLAVLAHVTRNGVPTTTGNLPTISSVRSLSSTATNPTNTSTNTTTPPKTIEVSIEANSESSIFTPTSVESVRNMKQAVTKLQKLRSDAEPVVGRVGVRAFARMTSPEKTNDDVQIEIKSEPIDLEENDAERQMEKLDLMKACKLRPVVPPPSNLREVRINKVVFTPIARKAAPKPAEVRPRAKKTFPQPKKPDDGRSELNSKNSMVYIPIQPPTSQAPVRTTRPVTSTVSIVSHGPRPTAPINTTANNIVNTVTTPLVSMPINSSMVSPPPASAAGPAPAPAPAAHVSTSSSTPIANVPTVHTVPLMTSVNGQWMFSLQPVMSVGANGGPSPMVNGLSERSAASALLPLAAAPPPAAPAAPPAAPPAPPARPAADTGTPGEPPRLQQRPALLNPLDASTPIGSLPPPSSAGPLTAKLNQNAVKLTDFFRTLLEDSLEKLEEPASQAAALRLQLEQARWRHQQEIDEIKHNHELTLAEIRASFEREKLRAVSEARRVAHAELEAAVAQAKAKQWCANCSQEAQFYCCWNTSYCDYPCQRAHWAQHFSVCTQQRPQDGNDGSAPQESRLQPQPDNMPKNMAAPTLTVGGKMAPTRVYTQDQNNAQKTSIIASDMDNPRPGKSSTTLPLLSSASKKRSNNPRLTSHERQIAWNLYKYVEKSMPNFPYKTEVTKTTADIVGVSPYVINQIVKEYTNSEKVTSPSKSIPDKEILSMVEDTSGNQTMKCVGTYKSPVPTQMSPLIINKQLLNNEDANKKVVTSGGYLIVGAGASTASVITPAPTRRTHTIQYFT